MRSAIAVLCTAVAVAACSGTGESPEISQARIGEPAGPNAALYLDIEGYGIEDLLISVSSDRADRVELHQTVTRDDGTTGMQAVPPLVLPASGQVVLEPGGMHFMLIGADGLEVGDQVEVTLEWDVAGKTTFLALVVDPADTVEFDE